MDYQKRKRFCQDVLPQEVRYDTDMHYDTDHSTKPAHMGFHSSLLFLQIIYRSSSQDVISKISEKYCKIYKKYVPESVFQ